MVLDPHSRSGRYPPSHLKNALVIFPEVSRKDWFVMGDSIPKHSQVVERLVGLTPRQQPVAKVVTAFDRPCIPADCVATRSHTPGMLPHRALSGGRRNGLGARATFTTDCQGLAVLEHSA